MFFNEPAAGFHFVSHEDGEEAVCFDGIGEFYFQHDPLFRIHGGVPQLFRVHFTQPFVALDGAAVAADFVKHFILFVIIIGVVFLPSLADLVERRLGNVYVAFSD